METKCDEAGTFDENFQSVVSGETTPTQLRKNLGMTHSTFYRYRKTFYEKYPELSILQIKVLLLI